MKLRDVPERAFNAPHDPVATKIVPDWDAMYKLLLTQGFVIIDVDPSELQIAKNGAYESKLVKAFNNHMRVTKKIKLYTKRISTRRWFCTL